MKKLSLIICLLITLTLQAQVSKTVNVTAGGLKTVLTTDELNTVTNLTLTGTIDVRDFKTMRDDMPLLSDLDLSAATIVAYSGSGGTSYYETDYPANTIPKYAFQSNYLREYTLTIIKLPSSTQAIGDGAFSYCKGLTSITLPPSITFIGTTAFSSCRGLTSIIAQGSYPADLSGYDSVFSGFDKTKCVLIVPYASKSRYSVAYQWKDFPNVTEETQGFVFNPNFLKFAAEGGSGASVNITANVAWTAASDQTWLTVNPTSGTGDKTLTVTAEANMTVIKRTAIVTFSATGVTSQNISISQEGQPKQIEITPGTLASKLSANELNGINNLIVTGTIDARDFKTMRDKMPLLAVLNLSGVTVVAYSGTEGTSGNSYTQAAYPANTVPEYAFYNQNTGKAKISLTSVVLPFSLTSIGNRSFWGCSGLTSATIPSSATTIGSFVFSGCRSLASIAIPNSLTSIESGLFSDCANLASITIPPTVTSIGSFAFYGCSGLTSVTIPSTVSQIGQNAFSHCFKLTFIAIPSSVTSIEGSTFFGCSGLTSVTIPSSVTSIGSDAFWNCSSLTSITIPLSVTSIGTGTFYGCSGLNSVTIPGSVTSIGSSAFAYCTSLSSIFANSSHPINLSPYTGVFSDVNKTTCTLNVPYKAKELYASADQWKEFTNINEETQGFLFDPSVLNYSAEGGNINVNATANVTWTASSDQTWLTLNPTSGNGNQAITFTAEANQTAGRRTAKVTVSATNLSPQTITIIQEGLPKTITTAAGGLFSGLTADELNGITNLTVTGTIDARDFKTMRDNMPLLAEIDLSGATVAAYSGTEGTSYQMDYPAKTVPENAFINPYTGKSKTSLTSVKLPSSITSIANRSFYGCSGLNSVTIPSSLTSIGINAFEDCNHLSSIDLPSALTSIESGLLAHCTSLKSIIIPSSVTEIGSYAFEGCDSLETVSVPSSVKSIGANAFSNCSKLISVTFPSSVTSIGAGAFVGCTSLTSFTIPSAVTFLESGTFLGCRGLTSINIPVSVTSIGQDVFAFCSGLTSIYSNSSFPIDLNSSQRVFYYVDKTACTLYVPYGSKLPYSAANQWKDFTTIVEMPGFMLSTKIVEIASNQGRTANINIASNVSWTASSDQSWLKVNETSGTGNQTLTFTAEANPINALRTATATVSAEGVESQTITVTQEGWPTALNDLAENSAQFICFPNPASNKITISTSSNLQGETTICIFNMNGAILQQDKFQSQNLIELDVSTLVKGFYLVKIQTKEGNESKKLVVQ